MKKQLLGFISFSGRFTLMSAERSCRKFSSTRLHNFILLLFSVLVLSVSLGIHGEARASAKGNYTGKFVQAPKLVWSVKYNLREGTITIIVRTHYHLDDGRESSNFDISDANLNISTDGTNFTYVGHISQLNGTAESRYAANSMYLSEGLESVIDDSPTNSTLMTIKLKVDENCKKIKKISLNGFWIVVPNYHSNYNVGLDESLDISIDQMTAVNTPTYNFLQNGTTIISYTKNAISGMDSAANVALMSSNEKSAWPAGKAAMNGQVTLPFYAVNSSFHYKESAYNNRVFLVTSDISIPAFTIPRNAVLTYNVNTQTALLNWETDKVSTDAVDVVRAKYKIQRADNIDFNNPISIAADYDQSKSSYSISIPNLGPDQYIRIARDYPNFDWALSATTKNLHIDIASIDPTSVNLKLNTNNSALISWTPQPNELIPGGSFVITRVNKSTGALTPINLTYADFNSGAYTDINLSLCNEYAYTLQVLPPANSGFVAQPAVKTQLTVTPLIIGSVSALTASKGYFPDRTELTWTSSGTFDNFIIKRATYGSSHFVQISSIAGSGSSEFEAQDSKGTPGVNYVYQVIGVVSCNKALKFSNIISDIGFRSPTGNVTGQVTFSNKEPVKDVTIRLQTDDTNLSGKSMSLTGNAGSFLKIDTLNSPFADSAFTVEAWIKPSDAAPRNQVVFNSNQQYELGFNGNGQLYFEGSNSSDIASASYQNTYNSFIHLAGIHKKDSLMLMVNDSVVARIKMNTRQAGSGNKSVILGSNGSGNYFKGLLSEVSVWNTGLNEKVVAKNYTRILAGGEAGLGAYWRFNESIVNQFYDVSHHNSDYNQNDGHMDSTQVSRSSLTPTLAQLSLKGFTDSTGTYLITGIPYSDAGTIYAATPLLGTHQFTPPYKSLFMSSSSAAFTEDFTDISSFPVSGTVYYNNSTVPVPGVQFKIDGQYALNSDGTYIQTNADGIYALSVPVGTHEVKAVKNNHTFIGLGKITNRSGQNLNYQSPVSQRNLSDNTTIRFIGRVGGGAIQEAFPLGHSLSVNNLGKQDSITIELTSQTKFDLNAGARKTVFVYHLLPSDQTDSSKRHRTRVVYNRNNIVIYPDSITGEFAADVMPANFRAMSVIVTGYHNLVGAVPVSLDFSNKFAINTSTNSYKDSVANSHNIYTSKSYSDTVMYNASYKFIKRVLPDVSISQKDYSGNDVSYFGENVFRSHSFDGKIHVVPLIDSSKSGSGTYRYTYPVFIQNQTYQLTIKAFEAYPFYESEYPNTHTGVVKQKPGGGDMVDLVPTTDGKINILNNLRTGSVSADTLSLNAKGQGLYSFIAGDPDIASKGIKTFSASVKFGPATTVNWNWFGNEQMPAFVMGAKLSGTNFVTAGPDQLLMVLRDPPGSTSYSTASKGTVISNTTTYSSAIDQTGDENMVHKLGTELVTFTGVGVGTINSASESTGFGVGIHHEEHFTKTNSKVNTTTLTTNFQTSGDPGFVGAPADVFVGYSTNITYGQSNNITMISRAELKASDVKIFEPDPASTYIVVLRTGINLGETFGTLFAYPQVHIKSVLIPNLISIRNNLLHPSTTSADVAQAKANRDKEQVYVSKLASTDPNFGKSNHDIIAFGAAAAKDPFNNGKSYSIYFPSSSPNRTDTISTLNQYVTKWQQRLSDNEKAKLTSSLLQNYSFHAGSPISYSSTTTHNESTDNSFNIIIAGSLADHTDADIFGIGFNFDFKETIGSTKTGDSGSSTENDQTLGFNLSSAGTDDYFSVDVNQAADNSFVFRTKGGVSACPYEDANATVYYQPGTVLDQPTQRIEVPKIDVDVHIVNNVASSRSASYTLSLSNESQAKIDGTFNLSYADNDSIRGATISIDGTPIGGSGRIITVPFNQTLHKVLTIAKGPKAMDYNNIQIILKSGCQSSIADTVLVSAHFIPSCSDIHIKSPTDNWVINSETPPSSDGNRALPVVLTEFDVNNSLFDHIELQYKSSAERLWNTAMQFFADPKKLSAAQGQKLLINNAQEIDYNLVMDDASFNDQSYNIRAVSVCKLGSGNFVTTESNLINGIKDTYNPRLFGSPQPANGILGISDNIRLNFNKTIAAGLLTKADFQVTGIRNGVPGNHTVSVNLDGLSNYLQSEFSKNLTGKSTTTEMWVLQNTGTGGTVFSQGNQNQSMELSLTADHYMQLTVGSKIIRSGSPVNYKDGEWAHVAMIYNATDSTVSALYNFENVISDIPVQIYTGIGFYQFGRSISQGGNYFSGKMHRACIWSKVISKSAIQVNSLFKLSGSENNLLGYYPMDEGKGTVCADKAHGSNAILNGVWSTPPGKAISLAGKGYVKLNTAQAPISAKMDYTIELWFKGNPGQSNAALASSGRGDNTDAGGSQNTFFLGFENKLLTFRNNGFLMQTDGNYLDNNWHHVAIAVNRTSGMAQLYADGILKSFYDAKNLGGLASSSTYLGVRTWKSSDTASTPSFDEYFTGNIDEFRIWNTYLNQNLVLATNNVRLKGDELGLLAYYPFENYYTFQNNQQMDFSLQDLKIQTDPKDAVSDATFVNALPTDEKAPIKDRGPVDHLDFDFVVNNDDLIVNMKEPKQAIDKTVVTIKVEKIKDMNGNTILSPITWTAYIDQNPLKWSDDLLNLSKPVDSAMQFESYIVNSGGNTENFTLNNLPGWLTASKVSGNIAPNGKVKIVFTVNQSLNVGTYNEELFMINSSAETESITLNLVVKGKKPNWSVDPSKHKYNMTVYGQMRVDHLFTTDPEDMLAAFVNGKCVGVTNNTYNAASDLWFTFLNIYGDTIQHKNLVFRIWQASTGNVYQAVPSPTFPFANNSIAGSIRNPIMFDGIDNVYEDIPLVKGWNWISFNVSDNVSSTDINASLANGRWEAGDLIKNDDLGFNQYSKQYGWVGTMPGLNNSSLFMLQTDIPQTLSLVGIPVDVSKVAIPVKHNQWSYISYLPLINLKLNDALAGYSAVNEDVIKSQSGFAMYDTLLGWVGNLTYLEPGRGYMLYSNQSKDTSFYYPKSKFFLSATKPMNQSIEVINQLQEPVAASNAFAENMTLTARTAPGFELRQNDRVIAYMQGEVRSKAHLILTSVVKGPLLFFNIPGNSEAPVYFQVEREGKLIAQSNTSVVYQNNKHLGSLANPILIEFNKISDNSLKVFPNPFLNNLTISAKILGSAEQVHAVQLAVYNSTGQLIVLIHESNVSTGAYKMSWNGKDNNSANTPPGVYLLVLSIDGVEHFQSVIKQ